MSLQLKPGDRVLFAHEKVPFVVQASDERYAVCTRPFNPQRTVQYTVVDAVEGVRGTEDLIFCMGAETREQCEQMLARLASGESGVSHRNRVTLAIVRVQRADDALGYRVDALGCTSWVRARTRGRAMYLTALGIREAGYARSIGDALKEVRSFRRDARADAAPICDGRAEGPVHVGWSPNEAGVRS